MRTNEVVQVCKLAGMFTVSTSLLCTNNLLTVSIFMQMSSSEEDLLSMDHYVKKTFYKTASLMANSCKAVAILGGGSRETSQEAWEYGRNLGLAFQVGQNYFEC